MAESLAMMHSPHGGAQSEMTGRIRDAALRMNSLVSNLLDMAPSSLDRCN